MYKKIMVPVDLEHTELLSGALSVASQLAEANGGELIFAGVHGGPPSSVAHGPEEYAKALDGFAHSQPYAQIGKVSSLPIYSHDVGVEVATSLVKAAQDHQMEVIVMASHMPGWAEHVFHSNAGYVACHAPMSVFVVR
ncbi:MAG: universal stress protein [Pseudomonadota bacterium]